MTTQKLQVGRMVKIIKKSPTWNYAGNMDWTLGQVGTITNVGVYSCIVRFPNQEVWSYRHDEFRLFSIQDEIEELEGQLAALKAAKAKEDFEQYKQQFDDVMKTQVVVNLSVLELTKILAMLFNSNRHDTVYALENYDLFKFKHDSVDSIVDGIGDSEYKKLKAIYMEMTKDLRTA